jgi:hypothetical protein
MSSRWFVGFQRGLLALAVCGLLANLITTAMSGFFIGGAVGGVVVDPSGVVKNAVAADYKDLLEFRAKSLERIPGDVNVAAPLRKVSLKRLQQAIRDRLAKAQSPIITEEMNYLAGLTRIQYIFVYPEENDIVLVGPAEALKVSPSGHIVGENSGQPVLQLDHLLMAFRSAEGAANQPITCSIDPTSEGLANLKQFLATQKTFTDATLRGVEEALGLQTITIRGVSERSDFARTMVAADYRMKRLAMDLDQCPGLPSYIDMLSTTAGLGINSATPRWWLAPNYEPLAKDPQGLAWELRGPGVKVLTEDSFLAEVGGAKPTGKASPAAAKWAEKMTADYDKIARQYPIFGELRNIMDLAVVAALIVKEDLPAKAKIDLTLLMGPDAIKVEEEFPVPRKVDTKASVKKQGKQFIVTASGGVEINSWQVADKTEETKSLAPIRQQAIHTGVEWWWN